MIDYCLRLGLGLGLVLELLLSKFKDISYNYVATDVHPN